MKKKLLFLMTLLAVSLLTLAEMSIFVYKKDGAKVEYLAANVDSIGFVNIYTITFDANGGEGSMDKQKCQEGESVILSSNTFTNGRLIFSGWNTDIDGSGTAYIDNATIIPLANITLYAQWNETARGFENGYEWVDLGLPSGTLWATCNVGAESPEDYGDYFAWGEIETKSSYNESNYTYSNNDAANANWGGDWRMPTKTEQEELLNSYYTTSIWTTQNKVKGYKITSNKNGNTIFLPAAGRRSNTDLTHVGSYGYYWSSTLYPYGSLRFAYGLYFLSSGQGNGNEGYSRYQGNSVRPVLTKQNIRENAK